MEFKNFRIIPCEKIQEKILEKNPKTFFLNTYSGRISEKCRRDQKCRNAEGPSEFREDSVEEFQDEYFEEFRAKFLEEFWD